MTKFSSTRAGLSLISRMGPTIKSKLSLSRVSAGDSSISSCITRPPFRHLHSDQLAILLQATTYRPRLLSLLVLYLLSSPYFHRPKMESGRKLAGLSLILRLDPLPKFKLSLMPTLSPLWSTFSRMPTSRRRRRHAGQFRTLLPVGCRTLNRFVIL